jgi:hypothetical protein
MMARTVVLADDIDGSTPADTIEFKHDGIYYEMELGKRNQDALAEVLAPFIEKARVVTAPGYRARGLPRGQAYANSRQSRQRRQHLAEVRQWLRENGHPNLSNFGQVPKVMMKQYEEAHR